MNSNPNEIVLLNSPTINKREIRRSSQPHNFFICSPKAKNPTRIYIQTNTNFFINKRGSAQSNANSFKKDYATGRVSEINFAKNSPNKKRRESKILDKKESTAELMRKYLILSNFNCRQDNSKFTNDIPPNSLQNSLKITSSNFRILSVSKSDSLASDKHQQEIHNVPHLSDFKLLSTIGVGCYGKVKLAKWKTMKEQPCVLKIVSKHYAKLLNQEKHLISERLLLMSLKNPLILKWYSFS